MKNRCRDGSQQNVWKKKKKKKKKKTEPRLQANTAPALSRSFRRTSNKHVWIASKHFTLSSFALICLSQFVLNHAANNTFAPVQEPTMIPAPTAIITEQDEPTSRPTPLIIIIPTTEAPTGTSTTSVAPTNDPTNAPISVVYLETSAPSAESIMEENNTTNNITAEVGEFDSTQMPTNLPSIAPTRSSSTLTSDGAVDTVSDPYAQNLETRAPSVSPTSLSSNNIFNSTGSPSWAETVSPTFSTLQSTNESSIDGTPVGEESSGSLVGPLLGGIIGVILLIALIVAAVLLLRRRSRRTNGHHSNIELISHSQGSSLNYMAKDCADINFDKSNNPKTLMQFGDYPDSLSPNSSNTRVSSTSSLFSIRSFKSRFSWANSESLSSRMPKKISSKSLPSLSHKSKKKQSPLFIATASYLPAFDSIAEQDLESTEDLTPRNFTTNPSHSLSSPVRKTYSYDSPCETPSRISHGRLGHFSNTQSPANEPWRHQEDWCGDDDSKDSNFNVRPQPTSPVASWRERWSETIAMAKRVAESDK